MICGNCDSTLTRRERQGGTDHHDLVLRAATWAHRSDSYYYRLDHPAGHEPDTVAAVRALLMGWTTVVEGCPDGHLAWLPHDWSDQYSGWLRCRRLGQVFEVVDGWAPVEGWSFSPSNFQDAQARLEGFRVHDAFGEPVRLPRPQLLADIHASLSRPRVG